MEDEQTGGNESSAIDAFLNANSLWHVALLLVIFL
jgi:hypothetical protein